MRELFTEAIRLLNAGEPFALATVVATSGSTPQKPGARILIRTDGTIEGTVGGGCVEADVWDVAMNSLREGGGRVLRDFVLSDDIAAETGMVCGGTLTVFIETFLEGKGFIPLAQAIERALAGGEPTVLATVVATSHPERVGAKLLVEEESTIGSLSENTWDEAAISIAKGLRTREGSQLADVSETTQVFIEGFQAPPTLLIAGAGHIAQALSPLAKQVGLRVVVIDDRPDFADRERFTEADEVICTDIASGLSDYPVSPSTAIVVATRGHKEDNTALQVAARSAAGYVGLVGSRRKVILIYSELIRDGIPPERLLDIHAPIGLDIGGNAPEEIALSIVAEVIMERYGASGRSLKLDEKLLPKAEARSHIAIPG